MKAVRSAPRSRATVPMRWRRPYSGAMINRRPGGGEAGMLATGSSSSVTAGAISGASPNTGRPVSSSSANRPVTVSCTKCRGSRGRGGDRDPPAPERCCAAAGRGARPAASPRSEVDHADGRGRRRRTWGRCPAQFPEGFVQVDSPGDPPGGGFEVPKPVGRCAGGTLRLVPDALRGALGGGLSDPDGAGRRRGAAAGRVRVLRGHAVGTAASGRRRPGRRGRARVHRRGAHCQVLGRTTALGPGGEPAGALVGGAGVHCSSRPSGGRQGPRGGLSRAASS